MHKIIFFGTSVFAAKILQILQNSKLWTITCIVTQQDAPQGRKHVLAPTPVKITAEQLGISVLTPPKLKDSNFIAKLANLNSDLFIVAAYSNILPAEVLSAAKRGTILMHQSLLPKYRGPSPIQSAILSGDSETGVSILLMDKEIDHGPLLAQKKLAIRVDETAKELEDRLASHGGKLLVDTLTQFLSDGITPKEQNHSTATFTKLLNRKDGHVDWKKSAQEIYNMWRAFEPWPGIFGELRIRNQKLRIRLTRIKISELPQTLSKPFNLGEIFSAGNNLFIQCGEGAIEVLSLQIEGKNEINADAFINGYRDSIGSVIS